MKKINKIIFVFLLFILTNINSINVNALTKSEVESNLNKVFRETIEAYYRRGTSIQYGNWHNNTNLSTMMWSPEDARESNIKYTVCARFTAQVYKDAFNIDIPTLTNNLNDFAEKNKDSDDYKKYVLYYSDCSYTEENKVKTLNNSNMCKNMSDDELNEFIKSLQPGDILNFGNSSGSGHAMIVYNTYSYIDENNKEIYDAYILSSTSNPIGSMINGNVESVTVIKNRLKDLYGSTLSFSFTNYTVNEANSIKKEMYKNNINFNNLFLNKNLDNINEGSIQLETLRGSRGTYFNFTCRETLNSSCTRSGNMKITVLRFLNVDNNGVITYPKFDSKYVGTSNVKYTYSDSKGILRTKYSGLEINRKIIDLDNCTNTDKTKCDNTNNIVPGGNYRIYVNIKNNSSNNYSSFYIKEEISNLDLFDKIVPNSGLINSNTIIYSLSSLKSNNEKYFYYDVQVKNETNVKGKTFTLSGKFLEKESSTVSISTGTKTLTINYLLESNKVTSIKNSYNKYKSTYYGLDLINKIYEDINVNLNLDKSSLESFIVKDFKSIYSVDNFKLNTNGDNYKLYSKMILNKYYSSLGDQLKSGLTNKNIIYRIDESIRASYIYPNDFKDGDILIYSNYDDTTSKENGIYAYIYIDGKFVGNNLNNNDSTTVRNIFDSSYYGSTIESRTSLYSGAGIKINGNLKSTSEFLDMINYQTLFNKTQYMIFRPSINSELVGIENKEKKDNPVIINKIDNLKYNEDNQNLVTINNTNNLNVCLSFTEILSCEKTTNVTAKNPGTYKVYYYVSGNDTYSSKKGNISVTISANNDILKDKLVKKYKVKDKYVSGFKLNDTILNIKSNVGLDFKTDKSNSIIGTGTVLKYNDESYEAVVYGDLNGDGKINSADLLKIRQHLLGTSELKGAYKEAGLLNDDELINSADLLKMRQHLLGTKLLEK